MKKKILSIILACCMSLTTMTPMVYAEETTEVTAEEQENDSTEEIIQDEENEEEIVDDGEERLDITENTNNDVQDEENEVTTYSGENRSSNPFSTGQCTWWAYRRWSELLGYNPNVIRGNAGGWYDNCTAAGFQRGAKPAVGAIVCWNNGNGDDTGHVAVVESISSSSITVSEYNWTTPKGYDEATISFSKINRNSSSKPNRYLKGYIYLPGKAPSTSHNPIGELDAASGGLSHVGVSGWAIDEDDYGAQLEIHVYLDSEIIGKTIANLQRTDVNNIYGCGEYHGYSFDTTVDSSIEGVHTVSVYAINVGGGDTNTLLGSKDVTITRAHDPFGALDSAGGGVHSVSVSGWAIDEDDYGKALEIHVYLDDSGVGKTVADKYRPDVNNVYGCGDYHGYEATLAVDSNMTGEHTVKVFAINTGGGTNTLIGSKTVNIKADTEAPIISECKVSDITSTGYTVTCKVTDDNGVDRVQFPTWTQKDGQDDIIQDWDRNEAASGTKDGDTYTYHVNIADHNNESGLYSTHIYAYDKYGNSAGKSIDEIEVPVMPETAKNIKDDFYATVQNISNNTFLTKVRDGKSWNAYFEKENGERTQIWHFIKDKDASGAYTVYCEGNEALVLDVADGVDAEKNNIRVWTKNGSKAQTWDVLEKDGEYYLKPACSNLRVLGCSKTSKEYFNAQMASYNTRDCGIKITEVSCIKTELNDESLINEGNYKGHHYEIFDQGMIWSDAKRICEERGGHLVTITSEEEQNFVTSLIEEGKMNQYWLGGQRSDKEYVWITGESMEYSNWDKGEPNGIENNNEYCAEILNKANPAVSGSQRFKWNDVNNSNTVSGETDFFNTDLVGFICEYDSIKNYTLTYDANGGTNAPEQKTDEQDTILKVSEDTPIRRGYEFLGWSTDKDAEKAEYQANDEIKLTKDITLYAVWEKMEATGTCGEKVSWELDQQGVLTIYGEGAMKNYTYKSEMPWYKYLSKIQKVVIEKGVTTIGDYAFYGMTDTIEITIPEGVTTIGEYAFKNSTKIAEVKLPSTLKKLGQSAFYGCTSLSKIAIPEGLYTIWGYTFKNCTSLAEVTLPSTLIKIDEAAFYGCSSLKKIEIPEDVSIIGIYCFKNCSNLSEISLPESMTKIREAAFYGTAITEITIPDSVTAIGSYAFKNCAKLKKVNLSKELKTIEESAFYACESMTKLILPSNVTTIGDYAFRRCVGLQVVEFSDSLKKIGESAFYGCSDLSELVLPEGMTEIGAYTFKSCTNVTSVSLPSTLNVIGESGFYGCDRIESIEIPAAVNTIGNYAFSRCTGLNTVTFKGDAPSIADYTFAKVKATVYYPGDNETWTQDKMKNYGGTLTWKKN